MTDPFRDNFPLTGNHFRIPGQAHQVVSRADDRLVRANADLFQFRNAGKRELTNAVLYLVDSGCKWRQLPHDFPPYSTVHSFYRRARLSGLWDGIMKRLVIITPKNAGRSENPAYAIIDSQSVKTAGSGEERGFDGGKTKGRKRHIVTDTMGNIPGVIIHAANVHDTVAGIHAAIEPYQNWPTIMKFFRR